MLYSLMIPRGIAYRLAIVRQRNSAQQLKYKSPKLWSTSGIAMGTGTLCVKVLDTETHPDYHLCTSRLGINLPFKPW